ncbi:MAG: hypothetical protein B7Z15_04155 [Rhizobiales bacterium 32-66-8]|nr:MAG: hypothetical protein B7Z15_04155 [Rhizobiales bacterium 32-66-8]
MNRLTEEAVASATPRLRPYKISDGQNLHLLVSVTGARLWRMRYVIDGREKLLSFGQYPVVGLADARAMRDLAKVELKAKRDPSDWLKEHRRGTSGANESFERYAREWFENNQDSWSRCHASDVIRSLERDVFRHLGSRSVQDIRAQDVLTVLRKIEKRPAIETAHRVRQRIAAILDFAAATGALDVNPADRVRRALKPIRRGRQPAVLSVEEAREVLQAAEASPASSITKLALRFLALTAVRPGVVANAPWKEFARLSPDAPIWKIPAERMKLRVDQKSDPARDHMVPLSRQAVEVIDAIRLLTGMGPMVFPNARRDHDPMSENAMGYLLKRVGLKGVHVPHGWRATFSTVMHEIYPEQHQVIELILAHVPENRVAAAYNRSRHMERRRALLQEWADMLLKGMPRASEIHSMGRP